MTARSIHAPSVDAISRGFQAALLAYPEDPPAPSPDWARKCARAARLESAVLYLDDWHRGVALARECCERAFAGLTTAERRGQETDRAALARLAASGATDREVEDLLPEELEAWDMLCAFAERVEEVGDPDVSPGELGGEDAEEVLGDDEQGAAARRLRWEDDPGSSRSGRVLVSTPWEGEP